MLVRRGCTLPPRGCTLVRGGCTLLAGACTLLAGGCTLVTRGGMSSCCFRRYNKRMRRWSIHLLCGLSLLIFLLAMGIWVRSYFVGDEWLHTTFEARKAWMTTYWIVCRHGAIAVIRHF